MSYHTKLKKNSGGVSFEASEGMHISIFIKIGKFYQPSNPKPFFVRSPEEFIFGIGWRKPCWDHKASAFIGKFANFTNQKQKASLHSQYNGNLTDVHEIASQIQGEGLSYVVTP